MAGQEGGDNAAWKELESLPGTSGTAQQQQLRVCSCPQQGSAAEEVPPLKLQFLESSARAGAELRAAV